MKLTKQVYSADKKGYWNLKLSMPCSSKIVNFTGYSWSDHKYRVVFKAMNRFGALVTDTDLIAHDDYIDQHNKSLPIYLVYCGMNDKFCGTSKKRLRTAYDKLKQAKHKVIYCASIESFYKRTGYNLKGEK